MNAKTQQICDDLSVCVSCYETISKHFMDNKSNLCHHCLRPCPDHDWTDLLWIGDRQVVCCGKEGCKTAIGNADKLITVDSEK